MTIKIDQHPAGYFVVRFQVTPNSGYVEHGPFRSAAAAQDFATKTWPDTPVTLETRPSWIPPGVHDDELLDYVLTRYTPNHVYPNLLDAIANLVDAIEDLPGALPDGRAADLVRKLRTYERIYADLLTEAHTRGERS
jgi:hypothetical protein